MEERKRGRAGFTLLEILVVIAILAVIGSVAVVKYMAYLRDASVRTAEMRIREVGKTLEIYYSQHFKYPETLDELVIPLEEDKPSVLKASGLIDPWKNRIEYILSEGEDPPFDLISYGPDGREGTEDDISYCLMEQEAEEEAMQ